MCWGGKTFPARQNSSSWSKNSGWSKNYIDVRQVNRRGKKKKKNRSMENQ